MVAIDSERDELPKFLEDEIEDGLESYVPQNEWNIDGSQVSVNELIDDESMITPIEGVLEPHPEGVLQTSTITPVENVLVLLLLHLLVKKHLLLNIADQLILF